MLKLNQCSPYNVLLSTVKIINARNWVYWIVWIFIQTEVSKISQLIFDDMPSHYLGWGRHSFKSWFFGFYCWWDANFMNFWKQDVTWITASLCLSNEIRNREFQGNIWVFPISARQFQRKQLTMLALVSSGDPGATCLHSVLSLCRRAVRIN